MSDMRLFLMRIALVGLLVCFGIFYGVDLAKRGMTNLSGPLEPVGYRDPVAVVEAGGPGAEQVSELPAVNTEATRSQSPDTTLVGALADATGDVLQRTARGGIDLIVSLFDGILH